MRGRNRTNLCKTNNNSEASRHRLNPADPTILYLPPPAGLPQARMPTAPYLRSPSLSAGPQVGGGRVGGVGGGGFNYLITALGSKFSYL